MSDNRGEFVIPRQITTGKYKHFKGEIYKVLHFAKHTENDEYLVIYQSLKNDEIYARPIEMFAEKVDKEKYPDVEQKYRFEYIEADLNRLYEKLIAEELGVPFTH